MCGGFPERTDQIEALWAGAKETISEIVRLAQSLGSRFGFVNACVQEAHVRRLCLPRLLILDCPTLLKKSASPKRGTEVSSRYTRGSRTEFRSPPD